MVGKTKIEAIKKLPLFQELNWKEIYIETTEDYIFFQNDSQKEQAEFSLLISKTDLKKNINTIEYKLKLQIAERKKHQQETKLYQLCKKAEDNHKANTALKIKSLKTKKPAKAATFTGEC